MPNGAAVTYSASASDIVAGTSDADMSPGSGSVFPIATTNGDVHGRRTARGTAASATFSRNRARHDAASVQRGPGGAGRGGGRSGRLAGDVHAADRRRPRQRAGARRCTPGSRIDLPAGHDDRQLLREGRARKTVAASFPVKRRRQDQAGTERAAAAVDLSRTALRRCRGTIPGADVPRFAPAQRTSSTAIFRC